jgi:hypothetical protein
MRRERERERQTDRQTEDRTTQYELKPKKNSFRFGIT